MCLGRKKKQKKDSQNFCRQESQEAMYVVLAETAEQSYFEKFSQLHSCVHPR